MASILRTLARIGFGDDHLEEFKQTGTDPVSGKPTYAHVVALEPGSIGGGGAGGGVVQQGAKDATAQAWLVDPGAVDISDRAARLLGHVTVDNASIAVTGPLTDTQLRASAVPVDVSDRVGRLLGHVTVDNASLAVTGTFWQATQPVSIAAAVDVSDRAARLLGHVTVDNASLAVTQSGTWTVQPGNTANTTPWLVTENLVNIAQGSAVPANVDMVGLRNSAGNADRIQGISDSADAVATNAGGNDVRAAALNFLHNGTTWDRMRGDITNGLKIQEPSSQVGTTISGANAGVTLTLTAPGAGLFHYITSIEIINVNPTATAIAGSAVTLAYTSTNLTGAPAWTTGNALAAGAEKVVERIAYASPVKSTTANTATTIVAPAIGAGGVCRIQVTFYTGP